MNKVTKFYGMGEPADIARRDKIESVSTILLALATLAITWCSYQGALWNGIESVRMAESNRQNRYAQQHILMASQQQEIDVSVALHFLDAVIEDKKKSIDYYLKRGKPGLNTLLKDWLALDPLHNAKAPPHPLAMEAYSKLRMAAQAESDSASANADRLWKDSRQANKTSDRYTFLTVIFSLVMFLGALSSKTSEIRTARIILTMAGLIFCAVLALLIIIMPVTTAGG